VKESGRTSGLVQRPLAGRAPNDHLRRGFR
jgi:hypothetical protein